MSRKFRNKFETQVGKFIGAAGKYETEKLGYIVPQSAHTYTPDFHITGTPIYIESKGRLRDEDRRKMLLVKEQYPDRIFVFVFQNENLKITKTSKTTYRQWAERNGFIVVAPNEVTEFVQNVVKHYLVEWKKS